MATTNPADATPAAAVRRTRATWMSRVGPRGFAIAGVTLLALCVSWGGLRAYRAWSAYQDAMGDVRALDAYRGRQLSSFTAQDLDDMQRDIADLRACVVTLDRATAAPVGGGLIERVPWIGARYAAGRQFLQVGLLLSDAGQTGAQIGRETLAAYDATGPSADAAPATPTWLDALLARQDDIQRIADEMERAKALRQALDAGALPARVRARLPELDDALQRFDYQQLVAEQVPALRAALGGDGTARYLLLFQNPAELRPSGGFPGTMGLVTIEHGQLRDYRIFDAHTLSDDYIARRLTAYPQPYPIQTFFPSESLVLHDATWWADFPRSGATIMEMYQKTGWPPINGVIAVQPGVISDLLRVTGPLTIEINDEQRLITPDNVYDEIERQRRLHREGLRPTEEHKEALALIGTRILERLKTADRGALKTLAEALRGGADRRDIQLYSADAGLQKWLDQRRWTGRLVPDPTQPTFAMVLANVVTNKASQRLVSNLNATVGPVADGRREITLQLYLRNTGTNAEDPFYAGFQRWWVELTLPPGSVVERTSVAAEPDPDAPTGGSYLLQVFPQQVGYLSVTFSTPYTDQLLLRRQPGAVATRYYVTQAGCPTRDLTPTADAELDLRDCR